MILYIETNFIRGMAKGQDDRADDLLNIPPAQLTIALPAVCSMEAWFNFETDRKRGEEFEHALEQQIKDARRDLTSSHARQLVASLEQARLDSAQGHNDAEGRFQAALEKTCKRARIINLTKTALLQSLAARKMEYERDDLILAVILEDAHRHASQERVLLTGDRDFRTPALNAGIQYFAKTETFLEWFKRRP